MTKDSVLFLSTVAMTKAMTSSSTTTIKIKQMVTIVALFPAVKKSQKSITNYCRA